MLTIARLRLAARSRYPLQLGLTVLLWQASTGVYLLSLAQRYLPDELGAGVAYPGLRWRSTRRAASCSRRRPVC